MALPQHVRHARLINTYEVPDPDNGGKLKVISEPRTYQAIFEDLMMGMKALGADPDKLLDHFSIMDHSKWRCYFPMDYHWISVYIVRGGSEGWYIHMDTINSQGQSETQFIGKCLYSLEEEALPVANALTRLLQ